MATNAQKLDAILAALTALDSRVSAIETAPIPTVKTVAPERQKNTLKTRDAAPKNTAPKAPAGPTIGSVVRVARGGYGLLIDVNGAQQWINAPAKGKNNAKLPALFKDMSAGQTVGMQVDSIGRAIPESVQIAEGTFADSYAPTVTVEPVKQTAVAHAAPKPADTVTVKATQRGGAGCSFCGGATHAKDGCDEVTVACLMRQYKNETGNSAVLNMAAFTDWTNAAPRQVFAHNATGSRLVGGSVAAPTAPLAPAVTAPAVKTPESAKAPRQDTGGSTAGRPDGTYTVTLVKFPSRDHADNHMVMVYDPTSFPGRGKNAGVGVWLTGIADSLYQTLVTFTPNDRIAITIKDGSLASVKRVASIEKDTGVVAGVKKSGTTQPMVQVTGKRQDDTKTEAKRAARKAERIAKLNAAIAATNAA